jgi:tRNA(adenine34) deaminase
MAAGQAIKPGGGGILAVLDPAALSGHRALMGNTPNYMDLALVEARAASVRGEVPVGAVLVHGVTGEVLARAGNRTVELNDPTAHAEMMVIREWAAKAGSQRLAEADLYVTLEPCAMCAGAISFARLRRLYFGAADAKGGAVENGPRFFAQSTCHHRPEVYGGIGEAESTELLHGFFRSRR